MTTPSEIAESLTLEDIPVKLRCATCNRVAQDAVRLPCCDQNICGDCQQTKLDAVCPICYHEPLDAEGCTPNKALRQTIRVFLKRKAIDRDNAIKQAAKQSQQAAATQDIVDPNESIKTEQTENVKVEDSGREQITAAQSTGLPNARDTPLQDIPQPSIESPEKQASPPSASINAAEKDDAKEQVETFDGSAEQKHSSLTQSKAGGTLQNGTNGMAFDPSAMVNMGANGMGDMNQMMQLLQNSAANPMMSGYNNMMGMPGMGMGMDPMTMQAMFNNLGGPGMINGMNMGMGFDAGQGAFGGGFNGQPHAMWNAGGQYNFNQGGFGNYGAGYNMPQHQGNFNQMHQPNYSQNDFHHHGHHNQGFHRGRGRGRGSYPYSAGGRGNYHQVNYNHHADIVPTSNESSEGPVRRGSPEYTPMNDSIAGPAPKKAMTQSALRDEFAPGDADDVLEEKSLPLTAAVEATEATRRSTSPREALQRSAVEARAKSPHDRKNPTKGMLSDLDNINSVSASNSADVPAPTPVTVSSAMPPPPSPSIPTGPSRKHSLGRRHDMGIDVVTGGPARDTSAESGMEFVRSSTEKQVVSPVIPKGMGVTGAPTGPKAMRQPPAAAAQPDTGFSIVGRAAAARARADDRSKSPHRSPSNSGSHSRHHSSRHHHRERSASSRGENGEEKRKEKHRRHRSKYAEEEEEEVAYQERKTPHRSHRDREHKSGRDRDAERSSRRSYKEQDRDEAEFEYPKQRDRSPSPLNDIRANGASKKHRSQHRKHDKGDDYTGTSSSSKRRSRDEYEGDDVESGERHRHHRHSKRSKHDVDRDVYVDDRNGHDKSQSSHRRLSERADQPGYSSSGPSPTTATKPDLHSLEREKRDRERQMKELQRRALAGNSGSAGSRRTSETASRRPSDGGGGGAAQDDGGGIRISGAASRRGGGGRKISVRYEDELDDLRR